MEDTPLIPEEWEPMSILSTTNDRQRFATLVHLRPWFPEADPAHSKSQTWRTWRSKRKNVLRGCATIAGLVLAVNVSATVYVKSRWKLTGDLGTIYREHCSKAKQLDSCLHILINILSTALLSVSNLCMQLLAAPTRQEVDKAHGEFHWLDIGVPSFRNLWHISSKRRAVVILLAATSIPLHFL